MPRITGAKEAQKRIESLAGPEKIALVGRALFAGGEAVKAEAQHLITVNSVSGKGHVASLPGQPPNNNTGHLKDNITVTQVGPLHVRISSNAIYSAALEYGSSNMAARPFMGPALRVKKAEVVALVKKVVKIATER